MGLKTDHEVNIRTQVSRNGNIYSTFWPFSRTSLPQQLEVEHLVIAVGNAQFEPEGQKGELDTLSLRLQHPCGVDRALRVPEAL